ncbi:MAG: hypothetical protein P1Q69_03855 [Candidatus Thorarchaeota archaeon]|nr:hypothetical protein [Candidatus Thorarchaeota archaeon]
MNDEVLENECNGTELSLYREKAHIILEDKFDLPPMVMTEFHLICGALSPYKCNEPNLATSYDVILFRNGEVVTEMKDLSLQQAEEIFNFSKTLAAGLRGEMEGDDEESE